MNALNNQWGLNDVIMNGRKHEADNRSQKADRRGKGNWESWTNREQSAQAGIVLKERNWNMLLKTKT